MRQRRRGVAPSARARAAQRICARLLDLPLGDAVAVYLAGADEIDLTAFIAAALARGTRLLAPRWTGETYALADLKGLTPDCLRVGPHGILEPREPSAAPVGQGRTPSTIPSAWLVPGLAFTRTGHRLGYGGGWYDRLLAAAAPQARLFGIAYSFQVVDDLPTEPHDVRLSGVVTEEGA